MSRFPVQEEIDRHMASSAKLWSEADNHPEIRERWRLRASAHPYHRSYPEPDPIRIAICLDREHFFVTSNYGSPIAIVYKDEISEFLIYLQELMVQKFGGA